MALTVKFDASLKKQNNQLTDYISKQSLNFGNKFATLYAEAFVAGARKRLIDRATPRDAQSAELVRELASSIHIGKSSDGSRAVIVPVGREGLGMFLEYGTGLIGEKNEHPSAKRIGWDYAENKDSYMFCKASPDTMSKFGFIFRRTDNYLDGNDINPLYRVSYKHTKGKVYRKEISGYTDRLGRKRESYYKTIERKEKEYTYHYWYRQWVLSQGLKPLRYMYDTRISLSGIVTRYRNKKDVDGLIKRLKEYKLNGK